GIVRASAGRGGVRWGFTRRWGCSTTTASSTEPAPESAPRPIGLITLAVKRTGKRRTGNPFAPFEVAGAGDGLTANLYGHEAGNGGYSQGEPTGHRASPRPYSGKSAMRHHRLRPGRCPISSEGGPKRSGQRPALACRAGCISRVASSFNSRSFKTA